jgi:hypothetical protein
MIYAVEVGLCAMIYKLIFTKNNSDIQKLFGEINLLLFFKIRKVG